MSDTMTAHSSLETSYIFTAFYEKLLRTGYRKAGNSHVYWNYNKWQQSFTFSRSDLCTGKMQELRDCIQHSYFLSTSSPWSYFKNIVKQGYIQFHKLTKLFRQSPCPSMHYCNWHCEIPVWWFKGLKWNSNYTFWVTEN